MVNSMGQMIQPLPLPGSNAVALLRKLANASGKMIPIIQDTFLRGQSDLSPGVLDHIRAWLAAERRVRSLTLYALDHLPEDPQQQNEFVANVLQLCVQLRSHAER